MSKKVFAGIMLYLTTAVGKELADNADAAKQRMRVYYDMLGDLDPRVLLAAAKAALLSSEYPTIPTPGALRQHAVRLMAGPEITEAEAWRMACKAANVLSSDTYYIGGRDGAAVRRETHEALPPAVRAAGDAIGWYEIATTRNVEATRAHFFRAYQTVAERDKKARLLPPAARHLIEQTFQMPVLLERPKQELLGAPKKEQGGLFE